MISDSPPLPPRVSVARNHSCLLFGLSWSHHDSFPFRLTHAYLGAWVLTARTGGTAYIDRDLSRWREAGQERAA